MAFRKPAPLTLTDALYLRPVQRAVLDVLCALANTGITVHQRAPGRDARFWAVAPVGMTRLHSALPLASDREFTLLELIDFYISEGAKRCA